MEIQVLTDIGSPEINYDHRIIRGGHLYNHKARTTSPGQEGFPSFPRDVHLTGEGKNMVP